MSQQSMSQSQHCRRAALLVALGSLGLWVSSGLGASAAAAEYYPHTPGLTWTYSSGETQVVGPPVTYKGVRVFPVNHQLGTVLVRQDLLEYRPDGSVWLRGVNQGNQLSWYATPLNVYPAGPLRTGQVWQSGQTRNWISGVRGIKGAAGSFNALVISSQTQVVGQARVQLSYFVPGLGIVRYQTADGSVVDLQRRSVQP